MENNKRKRIKGKKIKSKKIKASHLSRPAVAARTVHTVERLFYEKLNFLFIQMPHATIAVYARRLFLEDLSLIFLTELKHALDGFDGLACYVGRYGNLRPAIFQRVIKLVKRVELHELTLIAAAPQ